jgi:predicted Co/Zn/Cd cation transporter (cation efflux family)
MKLNKELLFLANSMVVQHIKVNRKNREAVEKLIAEREKDWTAYLVLGMVLIVAVAGFVLRL